MGGEDTEVTIDPMDTMVMVTMERDLLMMPLPNLAPTPTPLLTPGTGTTGTDHTGVDTMGTDMVTMVTMERDLLMSLPLPSLALTPMPRLTPGTGMLTGLTVMDTGVDLMVMPTGDKKWTSTTSDLSLPTHLKNASFCKTIFFLLF